MSCSKHNEESLRIENPILTGTLIGGASPSDILFFTLAESGVGSLPIRDVTFYLSDENGNETMLSSSGDAYSANNFLIQPDRTYTIAADYQETKVKASCTIPPSVVLVNITNEAIDVDPSSEGQPVTTISWNELDNTKYSYALKLENLEPQKVEIPFNVPSGNFGLLYDAPVLHHAVTLFDTDFKYYGTHRLTVYAIEQTLEDVYFYNSSDIRGLLQMAPDNVSGAQGYFSGVTSFSVTMLIE